MLSDCGNVKNTGLFVVSVLTHSHSLAILDCFVILFFNFFYVTLVGFLDRIKGSHTQAL